VETFFFFFFFTGIDPPSPCRYLRTSPSPPSGIAFFFGGECAFFSSGRETFSPLTFPSPPRWADMSPFLFFQLEHAPFAGENVALFRKACCSRLSLGAAPCPGFFPLGGNPLHRTTEPLFFFFHWGMSWSFLSPLSLSSALYPHFPTRDNRRGFPAEYDLFL